MKVDSYVCLDCDSIFEVPQDELVELCPDCGSSDIIFDGQYEDWKFDE